MKPLFFLIPLVLLFAGCKVELYHELSEPEANLMLHELEKNGIEAKKTVTNKRKGYFGIEVSKSETAKALEILSASDLPKKKHKGYSLITGGGSLIPSPSERRIKYYIALSGELEETLEQLPGVQFARVHFAIPPGGGNFSWNKKNSSPKRASVVLKVKEKEFQLAPSDIQSLVSGSIPDIKSNSVSVVIQLAKVTKVNASPYAFLGPFSVSPGSKMWILALFLLLFAGLIIITILFIRVKLRVARLSGTFSPDDSSTGDEIKQ